MKKAHSILRLAFVPFLFMICLAKADSTSNGTTNAPASSSDLAQAAQDKLQQATSHQDYEDAAALLKQAAKQNPTDYDVRLTLGWVYLDRLQEPEPAVVYLRDVVKHSPNDVNGRKLLGMAAMQTGRNGLAVENFRAASQLQPNDLWIKANLGRSLARQGNYGGASKIFDEVLKSDPNNADARLGQAEVAAWEGHSEIALQMLRTLKSENPTNVEVLTLMGDIHRWKWKLTEAKQDYQSALDVNSNNYAALNGMEQTKVVGSSEITGNAYYFDDTSHFLREDAGGSVRVGLTDQAYLVGSGDDWRFNSPGFNNIFRDDGSAGVDYHWTRWLETTASGTMFEYSDRDPVWGGQISAKVTPMTGLDIYTVVAGQQPFVNSIANVTNAMKQNSIGNGVDWKLWGPLSFQNSLQIARLSDGNKWWEEKPQLSWHIFHVPDTYLRVEYDHLSFSHMDPFYWSPRNFDLITPVLDVGIPICHGFKLVLNGQVPYVSQASQWGYIFTAGPDIELWNRVHINVSYYQSYIPEDQGTWSGKGGQASVSFRF
jgi:cytochrome c-type biogenesis protein CcmH/NrfG